MKRDPFKLRTPFFLPFHRRALTVGACLFWALLELFWGNGFWFMVFGSIGAYLAYEFFLRFDPDAYGDSEERMDE